MSTGTSKGCGCRRTFILRPGATRHKASEHPRKERDIRNGKALEFPGAFACLLLGLAVVGWATRHAINPDGIAYLRLAEYLATGQWDLALSGYWGPLWSWLAVPGYFLGLPPLLTARLVLALSGVVFWLGSVAVFRELDLSPAYRCAGAWAAAVAASVWSGMQVTPDVLLAGLLALAFAPLLNRERPLPMRALCISGLWLGLAVLAKPVGLALAVVLVPAFLLARTRSVAACVRPAAIILGCMTLVVLPRVVALSAQHGSLTFSTGGSINRSISGPPDVPRTHPFLRTVEAPAPGRLTTWEDPNPNLYEKWSPFDSKAAFQHQVRLVAINTFEIGARLAMQVPWVLLAFPGLLWLAFRRRHPAAWPLLLAGALPVLGLCLAYAPFVVGREARYVYPAWPFAAAASLGFLAMVFPHSRRLPVVALAILVLGLVDPARDLASGVITQPGALALQAAAVIQDDNQDGLVAGTADVHGQMTGLYAAFHARRPWTGWDANAPADAFHRAGVRYVVASEDAPLPEALSGWTEIGREALGGTPLRVFRAPDPVP